MALQHQHLLGLRDWSADEIGLVFKKALSYKGQHSTSLHNKTIVNLFFEPSTRTLSSFEMAIHRLGAKSITMNVERSSVTKGETLADTVLNLQALGIDGLVVRHRNGGVPHFIASLLKIPVINAGDGFHEHPTQGLLDVLTMKTHLGTLKGKNVLILGDIMHSRVARSNIWALTKLGAKVFVCAPPTLIPAQVEKMGVEVVHDLSASLPKMDVVNVLRVQYERQAVGFFPSVADYRQDFSLTSARLALAKPEVLILHPGPINRGIELDSEVADSPRAPILEQVTTGVSVRMAILDLLIGGPRP